MSAAVRPEPRAGQLWSAPSPVFGRRYVRIESVRGKKTGDSYVLAVECGKGGGPVHRSTGSAFRGVRDSDGRQLPVSIVTFPTGLMPESYRFEEEG